MIVQDGQDHEAQEVSGLARAEQIVREEWKAWCDTPGIEASGLVTAILVGIKAAQLNASTALSASREPSVMTDHMRDAVQAAPDIEDLADIIRDKVYADENDKVGGVYDAAQKVIEYIDGLANQASIERRERIQRALDEGRALDPVHRSSADSEVLAKMPLQYEDGPDYCTVRDAQGRDFALTVQPDLMKAMEKALSDENARFRGPTEPLQCLRCGTVDAFGPVSKKDATNG
ncbi:hypothetical protein ACRQ5Q_15320 [Bradyrhizobium sp. PMVTL-01]|uniref:hypothetical protein n=1 Tax=Bradyrhizobium sp. PMVTL-01 TaxID=3434999 RepID=UPI003F72A95D